MAYYDPFHPVVPATFGTSPSIQRNQPTTALNMTPPPLSTPYYSPGQYGTDAGASSPQSYGAPAGPFGSAGFPISISDFLRNLPSQTAARANMAPRPTGVSANTPTGPKDSMQVASTPTGVQIYTPGAGWAPYSGRYADALTATFGPQTGNTPAPANQPPTTPAQPTSPTTSPYPASTTGGGSYAQDLFQQYLDSLGGPSGGTGDYAYANQQGGLPLQLWGMTKP